MRSLIWLGTFILTAASISGCVTVPNTRVCTAAGTLSAGAICAETITGKTSDLTIDQYLDFLEPQPERPDPDHPGLTLPARSGALCQSSDDWNRQKTALEQACRALGKRCSYEVHLSIWRLMDTQEKLLARLGILP